MVLTAQLPGTSTWEVLWHVVVNEHPVAPLVQVQSSGPSLVDALGVDELSAVAGQLGRCRLALAATCRAGRTAVQRTVRETARQRSLWQLVGERWPLAVLHAKVDAMPDECEAQLVEMLSNNSMARISGFPFAPHITRGWDLVPAGTLLERAHPEALASLCARIPTGAAALTNIARRMEHTAKNGWGRPRQTAIQDLREVRKVQQALARIQAGLRRR